MWVHNTLASTGGQDFDGKGLHWQRSILQTLYINGRPAHRQAEAVKSQGRAQEQRRPDGR